MSKTLSNFFLWNNPKPFANSYEETTRIENARLFPYAFAKYNSNHNIYSLIKASLLLESLKNWNFFKYYFENFSTSQLRCVDKLIYDKLKYAIYKDKKIYLPFFPLEINELFSYNFSSLHSSKYVNVFKDEKKYYVDPFTYYGSSLFDSLLTKLLLINKFKTTSFFYHIDFETILVIRDNGDLENEFPLFDEDCKKDKNNLFEKLHDVSKKYFTDEKSFFSSLFENKLISKRLYESGLKFLNKRYKNDL